MKNTPNGDYQDFYQALTPPDYLADIEIQDEYEKLSESPSRGLSAEQVSQIATDSLRDARAQRRSKASSGLAHQPRDSTT